MCLSNRSSTKPIFRIEITACPDSYGKGDCDGPWGRSKGFLAWNDNGDGFIVQGTTPGWSGKAHVDKGNRGNMPSPRFETSWSSGTAAFHGKSQPLADLIAPHVLPVEPYRQSIEGVVIDSGLAPEREA